MLGDDRAGFFDRPGNGLRPLGDHLVVAKQPQVVDTTCQECPVLVFLCLRYDVRDLDRDIPFTAGINADGELAHSYSGLRRG